MFNSNNIITDKLNLNLQKVLKNYCINKAFILVDDNSLKHCFPIINKTTNLNNGNIIKIKTGEKNKNIDTIVSIWNFLSKNNADRYSVLINLGGGVVCDIGGFAASTFKRGIDFINIPTTLLSQIDAAVGGKTGFNFNGLKNEIGLINNAKHVFIDTIFLNSLDKVNILSGFSEMIKHALIYNKKYYAELLNLDLEKTYSKKFKESVIKSIKIKNHFVKKDPYEQNIRKSLNFGHTFAHAFESLALAKNQQITHGYAVAFGIIPELYLSYKNLGFNHDSLMEISNHIISIYGKFNINSNDYTEIINYIKHDKKNKGNKLMLTLLKNIGNASINNSCEDKELIEALNFYSSL
ncbi:MAG: 3-dehydroquinate synthase [Bacteroidetes bacterium]|nr:3-dehydroquinate synthase [Bacteroidota bacterium]